MFFHNSHDDRRELSELFDQEGIPHRTVGGVLRVETNLTAEQLKKVEAVFKKQEGRRNERNSK